MAHSEKRGFDNAAMTGGAAGYNPNPSSNCGVNPRPPPPQYPGGPNPNPHPPPYVTQPPYGAQPGTHVVVPTHVQYGAPPMIVTTQPIRENGPPPETTGSLIASILLIFFCLGAWPFAIVAIVFNRKAKGQNDLGQYTAARRSLRMCLVFLAITVFLGLVAWVIFGFRLKATLDYIDDHSNDRYYYGS